MKQLFTSDWHLYHKNIMKYCQRPFDNVNDMTEEFFDNLYRIYEKGDVLFFLGDLTLQGKGVVDRILSRFPRNLIFLFGNHDERNRKVIANHANIAGSGDLKYIKLLGAEKSAMLSHYPMRSWRSSTHGSLNIHGHSHGVFAPQHNQIDVGIDNAKTLLGEYRPFTVEEIFEHMG